MEATLFTKTMVAGFTSLQERNPRDMKYICPKCGRPVHYGSGWRYYCDQCDESWYFEKSLNPNLNSGLWKEIDPKDAEDLAYNGSEFIDQNCYQ